MTMAQPKSPRVSIRAPAWGATHRLALIDIDHIVSIRAPAWGANITPSLQSPSTVFAFSTRKSMKLRIFALR